MLVISGRYGERIACKHLRTKHFRILAMNYRCRMGEVDVVAEKAGILTFVEVKTRFNKRFGEPFEAVTEDKQRKIVRVAEHFLTRRCMWDTPVRFDVVSILLDCEGGIRELKHIENAFGGL